MLLSKVFGTPLRSEVDVALTVELVRSGGLARQRHASDRAERREDIGGGDDPCVVCAGGACWEEVGGVDEGAHARAALWYDVFVVSLLKQQAGAVL